MFFIILYLFDSKPVYLVDKENLELINEQLAKKESLSFEAVDPKSSEMFGVWISYSQLVRMEKKRAKDVQSTEANPLPLPAT